MGAQEKRKSASLSSHGGGQIRLENLTREEDEILEGAFKAGHHWVRMGPNGRIESVPSYKELPGPADDASMMPFWTPASPESPVQLQLFQHTSEDDPLRGHSPSIIIQHLCGYGYTPEKYKEQAALLESWGFECLRSRRGTCGQFWELWFLPGAWAAKGPLKVALSAKLPREGNDQTAKTKAAVEFIRRNASFGTLDVSVQRVAQVLCD